VEDCPAATCSQTMSAARLRDLRSTLGPCPQADAVALHQDALSLTNHDAPSDGENQRRPPPGTIRRSRGRTSYDARRRPASRPANGRSEAEGATASLTPGSRSGPRRRGWQQTTEASWVALLRRAAPAAGPFDAPHLRIRHRLPGRIPCGNVSHTRKALRDLLLVAFAVDADRCASVLGSLLAHKSPIVEPAGAAPASPPVRHAGFRKVDHCCGPCERREPLT
jgi:hypothetical protein